MGCGWWNPPTPYKEDCYWYREEQDMNARIPYCPCTNQFPLNSCENCEDYHNRSKRTQGDNIRAMSDEELAKKMSGIESFALTCGGGWPPEKWLDWLRREAEYDVP